MPHNDKNIVLAGIDGSALTKSVCDYAAWVAKATGAPLRLLHNLEQRHNAAVSDLSGSIGLGSQGELLEELTRVEQERTRLLLEKGKLMLAAAHDHANAAGVDDVESWQRHGSLQASLVDLEAQIRVLVLGVHGEDHAQGQLGSHLESVIRALHRPVLVVNHEFSGPKNILLAYDGTDAANKALEMVAASPLFKSLFCHLVMVGSADKRAVLESAAAKLHAVGIAHKTALLDGRPEEVLCEYQQQNSIDLTVMGAFSHHRIRDMLFGSFTAKMLQKADHPLLLLR
ncbi:universal stress protein [Spongiibacter sp. KMU-158]|uniref:Universal stress protein n=1 Tax=Spongiibacter pelagi TaxID=2760804 RepID=A0A927C184_9GAMM|nr:universal stress protein [Spongiibacter pelagi]MBD2859394.1 universal stress protein [Spongiibacter pelagi]